MSAQPSVDPAGAPVEPLVVHRMRWWDLEEVQAIERSLFAEDPWTAGHFWSELARVPESRWYAVARRGPRIVGYAGIFLVLPEADIQTVAVARAEQGQGIGRVLVSALVDRARSLGVSVVQLEVRADNAAALELYRGLGFTADGRRRDYYGRGRDALLMSARLTPPDAHEPAELPGGTGT